MKRPGLWILGLLVSAGAHVVAGLVLWNALQPEPIDEQPTPESELQVESQQIERRDAQTSTPDADPAAEGDSDGAQLAEGPLPRTSATPAQPDTEPASSVEAPESRLETTSGPQDVVDATPMVPNRIDATSPPQNGKIGAAPLPDVGRAIAAPAPVDVTAPAAVAAQPLAATPAKAATLTPTTSAGALVSATPTPAQTVTSTPTPAALIPAAAAPAATTLPAAFAAPLPVQTGTPKPLTAQVAAPTVTPTTAITAAAPRLAAVTNAAQALPPATETAAVAVPVSQPAPVATPVAQPQADPAPAGEPDIASLPDTVPDPAPTQIAEPTANSVAATPPPADKIRAELAFPGQSGEVDPLSLAAFQSFVEPGLARDGNTVRDGLSSFLSSVPCSRLQVSFDPETATLQVNGHVPLNEARAPVLAALQQQMGTNIAVSDNMLILPKPQCDVLTGIADAGLPQSTDQFTNPLVVGADTHALVKDFVKDDRLWFEATGPDYDAVVYVDFFDAVGNVLHVAPNPQAALIEVAAKETFRIGTKDDDDGPFALLIGPPYGQEIAVAFAASRPLYSELRPVVEPAMPYLEWLQERVAEARASDPDFKGEWVYFFIRTSES